MAFLLDATMPFYGFFPILSSRILQNNRSQAFLKAIFLALFFPASHAGHLRFFDIPH
jgi:hypothetical protein